MGHLLKDQIIQIVSAKRSAGSGHLRTSRKCPSRLSEMADFCDILSLLLSGHLVASRNLFWPKLVAILAGTLKEVPYAERHGREQREAHPPSL